MWGELCSCCVRVETWYDGITLTKACMRRFSRIRLFSTLWARACQASLSVGTAQARILEWVAIPFSRVSSRPRDQTRISCVSCFAGGFFTPEPLGKPSFKPIQDLLTSHSATPASWSSLIMVWTSAVSPMLISWLLAPSFSHLPKVTPLHISVHWSLCP